MSRKVTEQQARIIRKSFAKSLDCTLRELADQYDVSHEYIRLIVTGEIFEDAGGPIAGVDYEMESAFKKGISTILPDEKAVELREEATDTDISISHLSEKYGISETYATMVVNGYRKQDAGGPIRGEDYEADRRNIAGRELSDDQIPLVRERLAQSESSQSDEAARYDVSPGTISRIARGETYAELGGPIKGEDYDV